MEISEEKKMKIWDQIKKETIELRTLNPGQMTIKMFAEMTNTTHKQAANKLRELEKEGKVIGSIKLIEGKHCHVYEPVEA